MKMTEDPPDRIGGTPERSRDESAVFKRKSRERNGLKMLKLIVGVKGTGKTKTLINLVNGALEVTKGDVVCIEKGTKLRYDIKPSARLINADEYMISDAVSLYGFVAGMIASNHDVTDLFIDGTLKMCNQSVKDFELLAQKLAALSEKAGVKVVLSVSMPEEEIPASVKALI